MSTVKPPTIQETLKEWRELGTTGSTDGSYGEDSSSCQRRRLRADFSWLAVNWGIDRDSVRTLIGGVIDSGIGIGGVVDKVREHAPAISSVLDEMNLVHAALQSSCATGDAKRRREMQAQMVVALEDRGFEVKPADRASAIAMRAELDAAHADLVKKQAAEVQRKEAEARMVHPGKLVTHRADLEGLDSRDLRHVDEYYELWSCCGRGPKSVGCTQPAPTALCAAVAKCVVKEE
jgi:hypothetical protein